MSSERLRVPTEDGWLCHSRSCARGRAGHRESSAWLEGRFLSNRNYRLGQIRTQNLEYQCFLFFVDLRYTVPCLPIRSVIT